jgi:hypothetical protein
MSPVDRFSARVFRGEGANLPQFDPKTGQQVQSGGYVLGEVAAQYGGDMGKALDALEQRFGNKAHRGDIQRLPNGSYPS